MIFKQNQRISKEFLHIRMVGSGKHSLAKEFDEKFRNCCLQQAIGRWFWRHRDSGTEFGRAGASGVDAGILESFMKGNAVCRADEHPIWRQ